MKRLRMDMSCRKLGNSRKLLLLISLFLILSSSVYATEDSEVRTIRLDSKPTALEVIDYNQAGFTFQLNIGSVDLVPVETKGGTFILARADGLTRSHKIGEPNLPTANRLLAMPIGANISAQVINYTVEEISLSELGLEQPLMPVQPSLSKSASPEDIAFELNDAIYETNEYYSLPEAKAEVLGIMRSVRLGRLIISPIKYNPVQKKLQIHREITVRVEFQNADWTETNLLKEKHYSPYFETAYGQITGYNSLTGVDEDITRYPVKYVIVSHRMFETQLQPFIEWKTKKGFTVVAAYTDEIGYNATSIKIYLDSLYEAGTPEDPAPSFILLVGDTDQLPTFSSNGHLADFYYAEYTDDYLPEVYYGRFSAETVDELQTQIDKTLEYERYEMPDPSYLDEVTLVSGVDSHNAITYGNGQINYGTTQYFNIAHGIDPHVWLYPESQEDDVSDSVFATINDGIGFINYTAHCSHAGWGNPTFTTYNIENDLTNAHKYLLSIGNCCKSNSFDNLTYYDPCFGEVWLRAENKGGIGHIGATDDSYWDEDYWWAVGYGPIIGAGPTYEQTGLGAFDGVFHDHGEPESEYYVTNGAIVCAGNLAVVESGSSRTIYYWEIYTLMGDPSIMTYWGIPSTNTVSYPESISTLDAYVTVSAVPGSYVGISMNGQLYGQGYIDASGTADIVLGEFSESGIADIVVTAQNKQPFISTITVSPAEEPYLVYNNHSIYDLAGGNGNDLAEAGESIVLGMQVKNIGGVEAIDITAEITTDDPFVTLTDATEIYSTIPPDNGTTNIGDAFAFDLATDVPDNHDVLFTLTLTDSYSGEWIDDFALTVYAADLNVESVEINDPSGNNDNYADPGETVELIINISNQGNGQGDNIAGSLIADHIFISVDDSIGGFGTILGNGSGDNNINPFIVSVDSDCPIGTKIDCELYLTGDFGLTDTLGFVLSVGHRIEFHYDNFAFNQGWNGLSSPSEWAIGPAGGGIGNDGIGLPDPSEDVSPTEDNHILGTDINPGLSGDYTAGLSTTYYTESPVIDCSEFNGVTLSFYRWLGIEGRNIDLAKLEAYDGTDWIILFQSGMETIDDGSWVFQEYDVSMAADSNPDFKIRFGIGRTNDYNSYCGWNIDDILLKGYGTLKTGEISFDKYPLIDSLVSDDIVIDTLTITNLNVDDTLFIQFDMAAENWLSCTLDPIFIAPLQSYNLEIEINAADLQPGDFTGTLPFVSNDYRQKVSGVVVNLHIYAPQMTVNPQSLIKTIDPGNQREVSLIIENTGPGLLEFDAQAEMLSQPTIEWIGLSLTKGEVPPNSDDSIAVTFDAAELGFGLYSGRVTLTTNDPLNPEEIISIMLKVIVCGDANGDENVNISDAVFLMNNIFHSGPISNPPESGDANGDGFTNIGDVVYLVNLVFKGGPTPVCP